MTRLLLISVYAQLTMLVSCKEEDPLIWKTREVTVSAFNSVPSQTDGQPGIAAWGDTLVPGMRCVAVSRDLLALGIRHDTPIKIEGSDSIYLVKDKMHHRWKNRIDIYMGNNVQKAKIWGKKTLRISYGIPKDSLTTTNN